MIEKRKYEKPSMEVFKLQHQAHLLQVSGDVNATMNDTWTEEDI